MKTKKGEEKMKSKTKIALAIILTAIISVTGTYAAFLLAYQIPTTLVVKPVVSMGVFDTDGVTPLTSIDMGQFQRGMTKYFPGGETTTPTEYYYIKNTDELSFYVSFGWSNLPPNSPSLYVWIKRGDQPTFEQISGQTTIYNQPIMTHLDEPDPEKQYAVWYFKFDVLTNVPFDTYNPILTINAYSTATG